MHIPENDELLGFFGSEPKLRIPGNPWAYNGLTFEFTLEQDYVSCHIEPDVGELTILWKQNGTQRVSIELKWLNSIDISTINGQEVLIASGGRNNPNDLVRLWLNPAVSIECISRPAHG